MRSLEESVDRIALQTGFGGVVRVKQAGVLTLDKAFGLACRAGGVANSTTPGSRSRVRPRA